MSKALIIADLHLTAVEMDKTELFLRFCQNVASEYDQLFILGDLFNTWLGDDLSTQNYPVTIQALKALSQTTEILVMHGNRDFLLGAEFAVQSGAKLINMPFLLETDGQDYVLTHGDELCTDDADYQQLKAILQHPITKAIFLRLPKRLRLKISGQLRKKSVEAQRYKSREIMDVNTQAVDALMQKYPGSHLIHGHTHRQGAHTGEQYNRYVLGDWGVKLGNAIVLDQQGQLSWLEIH